MTLVVESIDPISTLTLQAAKELGRDVRIIYLSPRHLCRLVG